MNKCIKCGTEFEGAFCPQCGTQYEKEKTCPNCQSVVDGSVKFCNYCGYSFDATAKKTNKSVNNATKRISIWHILASVLPQLSVYALALFSLLSWAFFSAPFATIFGASLGNVYSTVNGIIDDYLPIAQTSLAFAVISLIYVAVTIVLSFIPNTAKMSVGRFKLTQVLTVCGNLLYVPFFALGCATIAKSKQIGMENGSYSDLVIAFSVVFAVISVGALIADLLLRRYITDYANAIDVNNQAKVERDERRRQVQAERQAQAAQIISSNGITPPDIVNRPDKGLARKIKRLNGGFFRNAFVVNLLILLCCIILFAICVSHIVNSFPISLVGIITVIFLVITIVLGVVCFKKQKLYKAHSNNDLQQTNLELINSTNIKKAIKRNKISMIVCGVLGVIAIVTMIIYAIVIDNVANKYATLKIDGKEYFNNMTAEVERIDKKYDTNYKLYFITRIIVSYKNESKAFDYEYYFDDMDYDNWTDPFERVDVKQKGHSGIGSDDYLIDYNDGFAWELINTSHFTNVQRAYNEIKQIASIDGDIAIFEENYNLYMSCYNAFQQLFDSHNGHIDDYVYFQYWATIDSMSVLLCLMGLCVIVLSFNYARGRRINRVFGLDGKKPPQYSVMTDNGAVPLTLEMFCRQNYEYDKYCKDLRYYRLNVRLANRGKKPIDRSRYELLIKKIKAIVIASVFVVALLAIAIGVVVDSQNIFKESKVNKIQNGMTKDEVTAILGKTEFATDYSWAYYSSNYIKLLNKAKDLSEQMANAESFEQALKIQEKIDKLQKEMENSTYKYITVTFDTEGKVTSVKYDFNYNPSKNATAQLSCGVFFLLKIVE